MCLVNVCASGGKALISRINLCTSATCRGLRPCLLWHLPSVSASAVADAKTADKHHRPKRRLPPGRICNLDPHLPLEGSVLVYMSFLFWKPWSGFLVSPYEITMCLRLIEGDTPLLTFRCYLIVSWLLGSVPLSCSRLWYRRGSV